MSYREYCLQGRMTTRPTDIHFVKEVGQSLSLGCLVMIILYKDLVLKLQILRLPVPSYVALGKQPYLSGSHL